MGLHAEELKARFDAKKKQLEADIAALKADARGGANDKIAATQGRLKEMEESVKDGWDNVTEAISQKLNDWLK